MHPRNLQAHPQPPHHLIETSTDLLAKNLALCKEQLKIHEEIKALLEDYLQSMRADDDLRRKFPCLMRWLPLRLLEKWYFLLVVICIQYLTIILGLPFIQGYSEMLLGFLRGAVEYLRGAFYACDKVENLIN